MFNGIIKKTGSINKIIKNKNSYSIEVKSNMKFNKNEIGSSISCSGACLTLEKFHNNIMKFYLSKETLNRTNFKSIKKGDNVNLEKSLKYGDRISGHYVQGHVDTTLEIYKIKKIGKSWVIAINFPKKYKRYLIPKASVAINGVSLTISKILNNRLEISIIPKTLSLTNLIFLKKKDLVNVEFDILSKYIKNFIKH